MRGAPAGHTTTRPTRAPGPERERLGEGRVGFADEYGVGPEREGLFGPRGHVGAERDNRRAQLTEARAHRARSDFHGGRAGEHREHVGACLTDARVEVVGVARAEHAVDEGRVPAGAAGDRGERGEARRGPELTGVHAVAAAVGSLAGRWPPRGAAG